MIGLNKPERRERSPVKKSDIIPGEAGLWVFIFGELTIFSLLFVSFASAFAKQRSTFRTSSRSLNFELGLTNTLILLTSSLFVVLAIKAARRSRPEQASRWFCAAAGCGVTFCIIKAIEYYAKIRQGIGLNSDDFFSLYFMLTGIHLVHVVLATSIILWLILRLGRAAAPPGLATLECAAVFWHLVDLLWLILFALFYALR